MLHHVSVGVGDVERAGRFYDAVLGALGYKRIMEFLPYAIGYGETSPEFWIQLPHNRNAATVGNGVHVGFTAKTKGAVNAFHEEALKLGGSNGGEPGPRPDYGPEYYGAFIYDLDGNKIEATLYSEPSAAAADKSAAGREERRKARKARKAAKSAGAATAAASKDKEGKQKKSKEERAERRKARKAKTAK
ncbi:MAG TPA: VOC family protein [Rhizomicrobium sp.]|nr:VOC family protein [Rhizomicrobium sp.]